MTRSALKTRIQSDSRFWALSRTGLICLSGFGGYLDEQPSSPVAPILLLLLVTTLGLAFSLIATAADSLGLPRNKAWQRPRWSLSPFRHDTPLQYSWFAAHFFLAAAIGKLFGTLVRRAGDWEIFSLILAFGIGLKLGVYLARRIFRKRFNKPPPDPSA